MFRGRRQIRPRGNRRRPNNPARRSNGSHVHLYSSRIHMITTKSNHNKVEVYPIPLSDLFDESSIGTDTDIRMVGYALDISIPAGNNMSSVEANIAHSGPWVRRSTAGDLFNQNFRDRRLNRNGHVYFNKRVLPNSEREYLSPHKDPTNTLDLKLVDVAGVIPGVSVVIKAKLHFIRCKLPTMVTDADTPALDKYEDQDTNGASITPPSVVNDIPLKIIMQHPGRTEDYLLVSDYVYKNDTSSSSYRDGEFTVTLSGANPVNKIGILLVGDNESASSLQNKYTTNGYVGNITYKQI